MKLSVILTGATGMVGEGVLHECLKHETVERVLVVGRRSCGIQHDKLTELLLPDLKELQTKLTQIRGYNACFYCAGVSSVGMNEATFTALTHTLTLNVAAAVLAANQEITFSYISGAGTDSSEQGKTMWARVKGRTENDLMKMNFKQVYNFRPGYIHPTAGLKNTLKWYRYISWMYPIFRAVFPQYVNTLKEVGLAMIHASSNGYSQQIIEVKDIQVLAGKVLK